MSLELTAPPQELRAAFFALKTREDIANLLDIEDKRLIYHLYIAPLSKRYKVFDIPKKSGGGSRKICAPVSALKIIQQKLNQILQSVYEPKPSVYGFVLDRNIRKNAKAHIRRKFVLNVDLKGFFPSINFGRVRGMFMGIPYHLSAEIATILAQICCFENQLPQGAPTSPVVSNMICARLDAKLQQLAKRYRCTYTRYADDITFSTSQAQFPAALAHLLDDGKIKVGEELGRVISENHFEINLDKVRLQTRHHRQEVTGLTVNKFPNVRRKYVRQVQGMLHAWKKYGIHSTEQRYLAHYNKKHRAPGRPPPSFASVVQGKIEFLGMIRGKRNPIYLRLRNQLWKLAPELADEIVEGAPVLLTKPKILTEGKTDWKHLKAALEKLKERGLFADLEIDFQEDESPKGKGADNLMRDCESLAKIQQTVPTIGVFDRDVEKAKKKVLNESGDCKDLGNNVHLLVIPVPLHRQTTPNISIEFYYTDDDVKRKDKDGRRLFLSNEFNSTTGRHHNEELICSDQSAYQSSTVKIVSDRVFDKDNHNVALSKNDFAEFILKGEGEFADVDVKAFSRIFEIISDIVADFDGGK